MIAIRMLLRYQTVAELLQGWCETKDLRAIREFHANVIKSSFFSISPNLHLNLLKAYTECIAGDGDEAVTILTGFLKCLTPTNHLPFNSIISYLSRYASHRLALHAFSFMHHSNVFSDSYALCSSLNSAAVSENVCLGRILHAHVHKSGWLASVFVGSALVDFYSKICCLNDAAKVFDEIPVKNTVCMNALMSGYAGINRWDSIIELVKRMPSLNLDADNFTLSMALKACCGLSSLELGKQVHANIVRSRVEDDVFLQSLLIETYGRCGLVDDAKKAFDMAGSGSREKDVILWTCMLGVYGRMGKYIEVTNLFGNMVSEGVTPDGVAFLSVISACRYRGQVNAGMKYLESMMNEYGLSPSEEHYSCVVDMLCRAGELERAYGLLSSRSNHRFCVSTWGALLSACYESGDYKLGKLAGERALELDGNNIGVYVLLSNFYARNGMWHEMEELREGMKMRGLKKETGRSSCIQGFRLLI